MKFETNTTAGTITMRGGIGDFENHISADDFLSALSEHAGEDVTILLDSEGGSVTDGLSIYNAIMQYSGNITVHIDAICASIATVIACAADRVVMNSNAKFMIHRAWTVAMGNSVEFRSMAEILELMDADIASAYGDKTDLPEDELLAMMEAETWMSAEQAYDLGFIDEINQISRKTKEPQKKAEVISPFYAAVAEASARRIRMRLKSDS
ncbi:Clp protease ClpP [bacterium]|nr:Clp protease ClpP [bacterium]